MIWLYRKLLNRYLAKLVRRGSFLVLWPDGSRSEYGGTEGFKAGIRLKDDKTVRRLALNPGLALGEAYMDETLVPLNGSIHDVLSVLMDNQSDIRLPILTLATKIGRLLRPILQANNAIRAKTNIAHHYDLNGRLYSL
ncbi:MAG TPA: SAM-dependent methyltransferase, partial [Acidocella sp.]|nr:SAM-dependent methyltransferase [Acidocella sp.]